MAEEHQTRLPVRLCAATEGTGQCQSAPPNGSAFAAAAATFLLFASLASFRSMGPPNTSLSPMGFGFPFSLSLEAFAAASRLAFWSATRSARSGSRHFRSFFTRGLMSFWLSGWREDKSAKQAHGGRAESLGEKTYRAPKVLHTLWKLRGEEFSATIHSGNDFFLDLGSH